MENEKNLISVAAWAKSVGVSRQRAYQWIEMGALRFVRRMARAQVQIMAGDARPDKKSIGRPRKRVDKPSLNV